MKKHAPTKLLIFNYVMDKSHPALAHQVDAVESLSRYFDSITVITGYSNLSELEIPTNVEVVSTNWKPGKNIRNIFFFYFQFIRIVYKHRFTCVFSHMTLIQSFLVAPLLRLFRIRHYVWYAHAQDSIYLHFVYRLANGILTSTKGSCPIYGKKVFYLGQSVDELEFINRHSRSLNKSIRGVHVGRLDPAKNIDKIIESILECRRKYPELTITFVGDSSSHKSKSYIDKITKRWQKEIDTGIISFLPAIPRNKLPELLSDFDLFVHGFVGSLDKTLIEATLCKLPVATLNVEYHNEFGYWPGCSINLQKEISFVLECDKNKLNSELEFRRNTAIMKHSRDRWVAKLVNILLS